MELYHYSESHIVVKEGDPLLYNTIPIYSDRKYKVYQTSNPCLYLFSIRRMYKVYHYYVSMQRILELLQETDQKENMVFPELTKCVMNT